jgi:hypothetical protein
MLAHVTAVEPQDPRGLRSDDFVLGRGINQTRPQTRSDGTGVENQYLDVLAVAGFAHLHQIQIAIDGDRVTLTNFLTMRSAVVKLDPAGGLDLSEVVRMSQRFIGVKAARASERRYQKRDLSEGAALMV